MPPQSAALTDLLNSAGRVPLLAPAEEIELGTVVRRWQDHPDPCPERTRRAGLRARDRIVSANIKLVVKLSARYNYLRNVEHEDLVAAGMIGLCRAAERFDPAKGYKFSTFAAFWISKTCCTHALHHGFSLYLPGHKKELLVRVPKAYAILRGKLQREPTIAEVAEWLGVDPQALDELIRAGAQATSLDAVLADGHRRLELIPAPEGPVDPGPAIAALEAMRRVDPDGAELLELLSEQSARDVAEAAGTTVRRLTDRARELRQRLRTLPEVEQALCA